MYVTYTVNSVAAGRTVNMDFRQNPFNVSVAAVINGTATYSVQHTFENLANGTATIFMQNTNLNGTTATGATNYAFPVTGIRGSVSALGTGSVTFTIIQATNGP